ncbi:MAG TPA: 4Fe-4S binding protein [Patescibacteria group bacterium]|nr:4Fe-4S binding protein [Patescibacteria group bacterium]
MATRKIIRIDEDKCNGCGLCIPNCPEGAIQIIDAKARLISDLFCDGLGACLGHCPQGAIAIEEREAEPYDEKKVMANIVRQGKNVIKAHLEHLKGHGEQRYLAQALEYLKEQKIVDPLQEAAHSGCPGSRMMDLRHAQKPRVLAAAAAPVSALRQWPIQIMLVPPHAPYFNDADLLIAADCVSFAYADFHGDLLKGKILLVGCPKLDNMEIYREKLSQIFKDNTIRSVTYAHMEVPCCSGFIPAIESALERSGKKLSFKKITISIQGEKIDEL